ncbi:MAG: NAD(P)H-dependent oxidoreductase subunit E, partial [Desulfovibrio sp.]|nr:NAD(P)H-dependent oxidoreductase subunit E [Desulfovibrio sp.]
MFKSCEELQAKIDQYTKELESKFNGRDGKRYVMLCGGTGCIAANSMGIKEKFEACIRSEGLEDKCEVRVVGCFGMCSQGPFVRIFPEDTLYCLVSEDDIEEIVERDLKAGTVVTRLLYEDPATHERVSKMEDICFYRKQKRIALHGCGIIDPDRIEEALGCGGYRGLIKALS